MSSLSAIQSATGIMRGAGASGVLQRSAVENLIATRSTSLDFFSYYWKCETNVIEGALVVGADMVWELTDGVDVDANFNIDATNGSAYRLDTDAADNDEVILSAVQGTSIVGTAAFWDSDLETGVHATIVTDTEANSLHNSEIVVGLKLASNTVPATDADQACWFYPADDLATPQNWIARTSVAGVDNDYNTNGAAAANRVYKLGVFLDRARRPHYYWDGGLSHVGPAVTANVALVPRVGVATRTAAGEQKIIDVRNLFCCQRYDAV